MKTRFFGILPAAFYLLLGIGVLPSLHAPEAWAAQPPTGQVHALLRQGIEKGFNMDRKGAFADIQKSIDTDRENPLGYAFMGLAYLFFYEMSFDEKEREADQGAMLRFVGEAISRGEKNLEKNARDGNAYFAMAVGRLVKVRWDITRRNFLAAARGSQYTWADLEKARELEPENFDLHFVLGLLHYHIDHLPGFTRFLSSLFVTSGDRHRGMRELQVAAQKGDLLKDMAKAELVSVYVNFEKQPQHAVPLARELHEKYPRNYNILFGLANAYSDLRRSEEAFSLALEIQTGIKSGTPPYRAELWPRYFQLMGRIHFNLGEYDKAAGYFKQAIQDKAPYNARIRAWALVRLGMIHDVRQERTKAEEYYREALDVVGGEGTAQIAAKQYLKTPYTPEAVEEKKQ